MIFLEGLECDGTESSLLDCPMDVDLGLSLCDHSDDAGIRCFGMYVYTYVHIYILSVASHVLCFSLYSLFETRVDIDLSVKTLCIPHIVRYCCASYAIDAL